MALGLESSAPNFKALTTIGPIDFYDWLGDSWGLLFSHPEDYTPVCTTELGAVAQLEQEFSDRNVKAIALSVDSLESHNGWKLEIEKSMNVKIGFPIIADEDAKIAQLYEMIHKDSSDKHTIRSVFIIGADKKIKLHLTYPMSVGRNFDEILRVIDALQLSSQHQVVTPANWKQGEDVIVSPSLSDQEAEKQYPFKVTKKAAYLRFTANPSAD
ncbi:peroxiredoxin [Muricauda sp. CAU 1633]|uniref:peroxiredoxin n=1 Tax=Allomuricauda sp. CAU 1633 TaxID=2816036 RepID=UPI001A9049FB|nr:peroxiredoxin [Muricauda sp. CAU 1633]MBO0322251.1 peroxiredoxin [Muricauda sp. CAU 1633]